MQVISPMLLSELSHTYITRDKYRIEYVIKEMYAVIEETDIISIALLNGYTEHMYSENLISKELYVECCKYFSIYPSVLRYPEGVALFVMYTGREDEIYRCYFEAIEYYKKYNLVVTSMEESL